MFKPIRLTAVLLICAALLPIAGSPSFSASADPLAGVAPPWGVAVESFAVLGATTVTNTGSTVITGDVGVSPGTAVDGFPPGSVTGVIHAADAVAAQAQSDTTIAYNVLAGQACEFDLTGQDLGSTLPLTPGVYCFDTSAQLTGQLTLDVQGDPNAVFVFQMGSTLTTASSSSVVFINEDPTVDPRCNVFWQVGSSATLGTATEFAGNIIALQSATLTTGASVTGKVLARNGAVTLDSNKIDPCLAAATPTPIPPTPTLTTPTPTATATATATNTPTPTATATSTPAATPTATPTNTLTPTAIPTTDTAVELLYFAVSRKGPTVMLNWATAAEVDNYGFNLYRAPVNDFAQAALIHFEPSALRGGTGAGATYAYLDAPPVHGAWWYWLADVDTHGIQTLYNPSVTIAMQTRFQIYLPVIVNH